MNYNEFVSFLRGPKWILARAVGRVRVIGHVPRRSGSRSSAGRRPTDVWTTLETVRYLIIYRNATGPALGWPTAFAETRWTGGLDDVMTSSASSSPPNTLHTWGRRTVAFVFAGVFADVVNVAVVSARQASDRAVSVFFSIWIFETVLRKSFSDHAYVMIHTHTHTHTHVHVYSRLDGAVKYVSSYAVLFVFILFLTVSLTTHTFVGNITS